VYPLIANFSWDDVLYFLIPLIWAIQFFLPNKDKEKGESEDTPQRREAADAAQERMRKVREEIRRRIEAQREGGASPAPLERQEAPSPQPELQSAHEHVYDPTKPDGQGRQRAPRPQVQRAEPVAQPEPVFSSEPSPQEKLQQRLSEQRERLAEARKTREAALKRTEKHIKAAKSTPVPVPSGGDLRSEIFATLGSPTAARKAIVLSEILGEPRSSKPYS
jgi:hypothetical protein